MGTLWQQSQTVTASLVQSVCARTTHGLAGRMVNWDGSKAYHFYPDLVQACYRYGNTFRPSLHLWYNQQILEHVTNWPAFQYKSNFRALFLGGEWSVKAEARPTWSWLHNGISLSSDRLFSWFVIHRFSSILNDCQSFFESRVSHGCFKVS